MIYLLLFLTVSLIQDDERAYEIAKQEIEVAVQNFVNPESFIGIPPESYWRAAMLAGDMVLDFEPSRFIEGRYLFFSGMNSLNQADSGTAISDFSRLLQVDPNEAALGYFGIGLVHSFNNELDKAEEEFLKASEAWPHWARPYTELAGLYMAAGRFVEAETVLRQSLALTLSETAKGRQYLSLAQIFRSQQKNDGVEEMLRLAVAVAPEDLTLYNYLGLFLFHEGRREEALETWDEALFLNPSFGPIRRNVAIAKTGVQFKNSVPFVQGKSSLRITDEILIGGGRFRAYEFFAQGGDKFHVRVDSSEFLPLTFLVSEEGELLDVPDIRNAHFSEINYNVKSPGYYFMIVTTARPGSVGLFLIETLK